MTIIIRYPKMYKLILSKDPRYSCAGFSFLTKLQASTYNFIKRRPWHRYFHVKFIATACAAACDKSNLQS